MGQHTALPNKRVYFIFFTPKLCQQSFFSKNQALSIDHGATIERLTISTEHAAVLVLTSVAEPHHFSCTSGSG
jgi:hypothetical protein